MVVSAILDEGYNRAFEQYLSSKTFWNAGNSKRKF